MLDNDACDKLKLTMMTAGWNEVILPLLANRANAAIKALVLLPTEREGEFKGVGDDVIRARIREIEWMMTAWKNEVAVNAHNRRLDELDLSKQDPSTANP